ncbi:MAG TPA: alpha/beta fold hydrolase, partial [Leptospiraceae bacterium]|nr:alpha/beta fold hydrolase [Leptospiraceae bacterium]
MRLSQIETKYSGICAPGLKNTDPAGALLRFQEVGQGHPLIILHGLFGSGRNWGSVARSLSEKFRVFSLDQRNHGDSPQFPSHTLDDLAKIVRFNRLVTGLVIRGAAGFTALADLVRADRAFGLADRKPGWEIQPKYL